MKATFVIVVLFGLCAWSQGNATFSSEASMDWDSYKFEFDKIYDDEAEESLRRLIFEDNKKTIDAHNERYAAGEESYEMGVNQFTDMLEDEISQITGSNDDVDIVVGSEMEPALDYDDMDLQLPAKVNWTQMGAVTPVVYQGHFNTSWAFAAAGVVESRQFIKSGRLVALSKQNLIDCCKLKNKRTAAALICIKKMKGIDTETSYSYRGVMGRCTFKRKFVGAKIKKIFQVRPGNEKALAFTVTKGPVAAVISQAAIRTYKQGVYNNPRCGQSPDYPVLIVGYGTCKNHGDYWIVKTSLGARWGEKGYLKLARNKRNLCGITNRVYYPELN